MRHAVSSALLLSTFVLPISPVYAAARTDATPRVQFSVTIAAATDPDLAVARVTPHTVSINQVMISNRPWGEARVGHFELQVISGKDALRLMTALAKAPSMGKPSLDMVPNGGEDTFMRSKGLHQSRQFFLRPHANADGTITLSFAFKELPTAAVKPAPFEMVDETKDASTIYTEIGTVHNGETIALTGPRSNGEQLIAFVTPTIL